MKKIVKKKLDEMTEDEINQLYDSYCTDDAICDVCAFRDKDFFKCFYKFIMWKKLYIRNKDKEFEIEVKE